jgi:hypothetical protein
MSEALPAFAPLPTWFSISGLKRSKTYEELKKGNLRAKKCGKSILIDVAHGLEYINSLPDAQIGKGA